MEKLASSSAQGKAGESNGVAGRIGWGYGGEGRKWHALTMSIKHSRIRQGSMRDGLNCIYIACM